VPCSLLAEEFLKKRIKNRPLIGSTAMSRLSQDDDRVRDSYEQVPYPALSHPEAQPDVLATLAFLHGIDPPPLATCRVLELGCAAGTNLMPAALRLPGARFVGIDLSPGQIEAGRRRVEALGLTNVELRVVSFRSLFDEVGTELGTFDYIIAHGLYSWVAEPLQDEILRLCGERLSPHGVAYLSYNTLPGWHADLKLRGILQYHNRGLTDPRAITDRSLDLIGFLADAAAGLGDEDHAQALRTARRRMESFRTRPSYLLHDYLEDSNFPVYFHQLAASAARHGLQYLSDAEPAANLIDDLPPAVADGLRELAGDRIELEQYIDFLRDRRFRRTLLCHQGIALDRTMVPRRMKSLWAASEVTLDSSPPDLAPGVPVSFRNAAGAAFSSTHAVAKAALVHLSTAWPRAVLFDDLLRGIRERRAAQEALEGTGGVGEVESLADILHTLFFAGVVRLHLVPPECAGAPGDRPRVTPLARLQAAAGELITNQLCRTLEIEDEDTRRLLLHLDGRHDRTALAGLVGKDLGWIEGQLGRLVEVGLLT